MKNFFKAIGNFFKKIGLFIWKCLKVSWNYIKENAWLQPIAIVVLIFGLVFGFQGIVEGVEKIKASSETKNNKKDLFDRLTMKEVREKLDNGDDFVLFIGAHDCVYCQDFKTVVNRYIKSNEGKMIYYIDIHDSSDTSIDGKYLTEWAEMLQDIDTRDFDGSLSTPTVVVIRGGEFADAKSGAQGLSGGTDYLNFVKFVEGEYIDKIEPSAA